MDLHTTTATEGSLRVWWIRQVPGEPEHWLVIGVEAAKKRLRALTEADLRNPLVTDNAGGLEVFEDGDWCEWYSEDGDSIEDVMAAEDDGENDNAE